MDNLTQFQTNNGGSGAFQFGNGGGFSSTGVAIAPPNTSAPVPSSQITTGAVNTPPAPPVNDGSSLVAGIVGSGAAIPAGQPTSSTPATDMATTGDYTQDPNYKSALNDYNQSVNDAQTAANDEPSQSKLLSDAQVAQGTAAKQANVNELQTRLNSANATFDKMYADAEAQPGMLSSIVTGQQGAIRRQQAVEAGVIATQLATAQGQYDHAEALAEKTANLQFLDAQNKIDNKFKFIQLNSDNLSRTEQVAVSKMQAEAKQQQDQLDQQKEARTFALTNGITAPYYEMGGTVYRSSDGTAFKTPAEAQAAGVDTTNWSNVQQLNADSKAVKFSDVTIGSGKNAQKFHIGYSANGNIVSKINLATGQPVSLSGGTSTSSTTTTPTTKIAPASGGSLTAFQLSKVNSIIKANPGEYGHAANEIDKEFGAGTSGKADTLLKSAYMIPADALDIINNSGSPPSLDAWNKGLTAFVNAHNYNPSAARAAYVKYIPKPAKTSSRQP